MFTVAEINDPQKLGSFSLVWQTLWDRTPRRSFLQTREWLDCCCRRFDSERKLRVLMVQSATRPIGIVPLVIKRVRTRLGSLRMLTYPLEGFGPFFGPIGSDPTATLFGALKHLADTPRDWDLIDLRGVDDERLDKGRTANAFRLSRLPATRRVWERNLEIPVADWTTAEQFQHRRRIREAEKTLWRRGAWEFARIRLSADDPLLAEECRKRFEESRSLFALPEFAEPWWNDVLEAAICTGTADICQLWLNDRLIAAAFNTVADERVQPMAIGVNPNLGDAARTTFLGRMLLDGLDRGDGSYVFGVRTAEWAEEWLPTIRPSYRFTHFAGLQPQAQLLRLNELRKQWWRNLPQQTAATA